MASLVFFKSSEGPVVCVSAGKFPSMAPLPAGGSAASAVPLAVSMWKAGQAGVRVLELSEVRQLDNLPSGDPRTPRWAGGSANSEANLRHRVPHATFRQCSALRKTGDVYLWSRSTGRYEERKPSPRRGIWLLLTDVRAWASVSSSRRWQECAAFSLRSFLVLHDLDVIPLNSGKSWFHVVFLFFLFSGKVTELWLPGMWSGVIWSPSEWGSFSISYLQMVPDFSLKSMGVKDHILSSGSHHGPIGNFCVNWEDLTAWRVQESWTLIPVCFLSCKCSLGTLHIQPYIEPWLVLGFGKAELAKVSKDTILDGEVDFNVGGRE